MRYLLILSTLLFFACNENKTGAVNQAEAKVSTVVEKEAKPKVGNKPVAPKVTLSSDVLYIAAQDKVITQGGESCVPIIVRNFNNIVSTQYSINWNPKELKFINLEQFNLKDLSANNFGRHIAKEGKLTLSWFDQDIKGVSVPDETPIYTICYEAMAEKGKKSKIIFTQDPIEVEITGPNATFLKFSSEPGYVKIK